MTLWREVTLGDMCERVTVGHVGRMAAEYVSSGVPFLRSQNVRPFIIDRDKLLWISDDFHRTLAKSALRTGDVVVVRTGYPGTAAVVPPELQDSNCADLVVITPTDRLNPHMLAAIFNSTWGRSAVGGRLVGSAQQHFNVGSAKALRVRLPPRPEQDRIAAVLCALNDLIDNNRRRIELLEQMAQAIYREWFVRFRYSGHGNVTFSNSPLGAVPDGWRVERLDRIALVNRSSRKPGHDETVRYLDISTLADRSIGDLAVVSGSDAPGRARRVVAAGDVVWSMVRPNRRAHALLVAPGEDWIASTGLAVLSPTAISSTLLFEIVSAQEFTDYLVSQEGGAAYPAVKPKDFEAAPLLIPTPEVSRCFTDAVGPLHRLTWELRHQSSCLASLRDLLLPRLVTGQIDVSHVSLDGLTEPVA